MPYIVWAMSDIFWQSIIAGVVTLVLAYFGKKAQQAGEKAEAAASGAAKAATSAAKEVAEVASSAARSQEQLLSQSVTTLQKIEEVHIATNSMKDALVKATAEASHAAGKEEGRAEKK